MIRHLSNFAAAMTAAILVAAPALAGTYKTITIDDFYGDWAGVPVVDSDAGDNIGGPDIGDTQIANDGQYLYIRNTFPNNLILSTYIAVDVDQNPATGFDIFSLGSFGSEAGWQNDFGFSQATGTFNSGPLIGADFFGAGHALLAPFGNFSQRELAISLANANNGGAATFPGNTIRLLIYSDTGAGADGIPAGFPGDSGINGDTSAVIDYTLAVPEPESAYLLMMGMALGVTKRRRTVSRVSSAE